MSLVLKRLWRSTFAWWLGIIPLPSPASAPHARGGCWKRSWNSLVQPPFVHRGGNWGPGGRVEWEELICLESHTWFTAKPGANSRVPSLLSWVRRLLGILTIQRMLGHCQRDVVFCSHSHSHVHTVSTWAHPPCKHRVLPPLTAPVPYSPFLSVLCLCQLVLCFYQNTVKKGMSRSSITQFILQLLRLGVSTPGEETDSERLRKLP